MEEEEGGDAVRVTRISVRGVAAGIAAKAEIVVGGDVDHDCGVVAVVRPQTMCGKSAPLGIFSAAFDIADRGEQEGKGQLCQCLEQSIASVVSSARLRSWVSAGLW